MVFFYLVNHQSMPRLAFYLWVQAMTCRAPWAGALATRVNGYTRSSLAWHRLMS